MDESTPMNEQPTNPAPATRLRCCECSDVFFSREWYLRHLRDSHPDVGLTRLLKMRGEIV